MIRIYPGDLLQIGANDQFYYAVVLDKISLFGGQLCFVFHRTSSEPQDQVEVMLEPLSGFFEIVDFIWAKREERIERIAKKLNIDELNGRVTFFKNAHRTKEKEKAKDWWIYDREGTELRRVKRLTDDEKRYPLLRRIDDTIMVELVDQQWSPEHDHRI